MPRFRRTKRIQPVSSRRLRSASRESTQRLKFDLGQLVAAFTFLVFVVVVVLVCFAGLSPAGPQILPNQAARVRIVAEFPFSYESAQLTERLIEQSRNRVPPIYRLSFNGFERFKTQLEGLQKQMEKLDREVSGLDEADRQASFEAFFVRNATLQTYKIDSKDLLVLFRLLDNETRESAIANGLNELKRIYEEGIYDSDHEEIRAAGGDLSLFHIQEESGAISQVRVQSDEDALRSLRLNLSSLDVPRDVYMKLNRILRHGLEPNLVFDAGRSAERIREIVDAVEPVVVSVREGQTIIEPNTKVSDLQIEQLAAYRRQMRETSESGILFDALLWERVLMTFAILLCAVIVLKVGHVSLRDYTKEFALSGIIILLNLALIRIVLETGDIRLIGEKTSDFAGMLPFLSPVALGAFLVTILLGTGQGIFVALVVSVLNALMQDGSLIILLISFLSVLVGIYACQNIQVRARVVRAGGMAGLSLAICAFFMGMRDGLDGMVIVQNMIASQVIGVVTGIAVLGFLPILENLFKFTTDITLLELTDFNHPLLRRMQVNAPGSYHHSLMVANLSENAAATIGANPLMCRVCSLFHDIGKLVKPEYFAENQHDGINPLLETNPSMSALIIRSHVKEGILLAEQHKLPRVIMDVIREHHGTTLIQYFYDKALERHKSTDPPFYHDAPHIEVDEVTESTYRYEGPKPQFRESAVIFFADGVEAASRSLRKVTPQSINELIDSIFSDRITDGQLTECALTLEELDKIKRSFAYTALNMLHSRLEYPEKKKGTDRSHENNRTEQSKNGDSLPSSSPAQATPTHSTA